MQFYNYFTTPSGRYCTLNEITNKDYLVLVKFAESKNIRGFFQALDKLIEVTIEDFQDFNIVDKVYTYIAYTLYSIRPDVSVKGSERSTRDTSISLVFMLNQIEKAYEDVAYVEKINEQLDVIVHLPSKLEISDDEISIDYVQSIDIIIFNGQEMTLTDKERDDLIKQLPQKNLISIQSNCEKVLKCNAKIFGSLQSETNIASSGALYLVMQIISETLESFYWRLFTIVHFVKMSQEAFMSMTPLETQILTNNFKYIQEEQSKQQESATSMRTSLTGPQIK